MKLHKADGTHLDTDFPGSVPATVKPLRRPPLATSPPPSWVKRKVALPLLTMSAKLIDFFDFACEIAESRTTSSPAGTPIEAAAASVNAIRPAAPARLMASKFIMVDQLPPVICAPNTGSLNFGSLEAS